MPKSIRTQPNSAVTLSVLDRLTDNDPKSPTVEAPLSRAESVRALKAGVRRDLEWLLNTRRTPDEPGVTRDGNRKFALQLRTPGFQRLQHCFAQGSNQIDAGSTGGGEDVRAPHGQCPYPAA